MAVGPYVTGPCQIKVNFRDGNGLQWLGYSENGIEVQENFLYVDVNSDRYGGTSGAPIDRQFMGATARIPVQLSEFDPEVLDTCRKYLPTNGAGGETTLANGELPAAGCLVAAENQSLQVVLVGLKDAAALVADANALTLSPLNFLNCFYDGSSRINIAARHAMPAFDFLALPSTADGTTGDGKTRLYVPRSQTVYNDLKNIDLTP
jgi:hypothetical protein